jgi:(p)ppGpp synthase/HD superfamily hydrolase
VITAAEADALAQRAHGDERNHSGMRYIDHVRRVADRVKSDPDQYAVSAALLHDTVEKGGMSWHDLRAAGADDRLLEVVDALTEREGEPERSYLARAADDAVALRIKRADIEDKLYGPLGESLTEEQRHRAHERARRRLDLLERLARERA